MLTPESRLEHFPSLEGMTYLNSAAESIPPLAVSDALRNYFEHKSKGMRGRVDHFAEMEKCREVAARMLKKTPAEVSFCSCSSEAYNLLNSALKLGPDDEVVISNLDFPAGATPWLASADPPRTRVWKSRDGGLELDDLQQLLSEKTRLVQVSLVSFLNGYRINWAPIRDLVRKLAPNATLAVDITQGFGRVELDCLDADVIISSTHKWILGLHGGCVVAIADAKADQLTPYAGGWFHLENAFDPDRFERAPRKRGAAGFSVGMPSFAAIYGLRAGMEFIENVGVGEIAAQADPLVARVHSGLEELGLSPMAPPSKSGIVAFQDPRVAKIHEGLEEREIHVMHHAGRIRIAVHGYNQAEDVEKLLGAISDLC
ncbi:MAG: cysteine desulfurase/selenocysteine lyase [Verrucomicrobiales bacterium]|jgi:cysteine desulfurase/selenocysteine lyase